MLVYLLDFQKNSFKKGVRKLRGRDLLNVRTASFIFWLVLSIIMIITMPNLDILVREKGQVEMPSNVQSAVAERLQTKMQADGKENYEFIAVFHSKEKMTDEQKKEIDDLIDVYREKQDELGITHILAYNESEETEKQLVSEDGTTILMQIAVEKDTRTVEEVAQQLRKLADTKTVDTYFTGTDIVLDDFAKSSQEGIKKTEIIAVVFILIVLILVFRSPIVPLISLITVGVSYIVSLGIVAQLVEHFDYPFSNFTQVFIVVVLFGIGTDYNILLYNRFKEEVSKGGHILKAITETYRTAGKTVIYSGLAVFIGFMALYLADFKLYQATSAVAIGVAVLLLVLITLNPFFMAVLGFKMFWPAKQVKGHQENKLWKVLSKFSLYRPLSALAIIAVICIPFIVSNSGELNYNDLVEINDKYESKQAIKVIEEHFPAGFSAPAYLMIQSKESLATQKALQDLDKLTEAISKVEGVSEVYSVTRPAGEKIKELYVQEQVNTLTEGLGSAEEGVTQIHEGLSEADKELGKADGSKFDSVQQLIDGTKEMEQGVGQLNDALSQLSQGFKDGAKGAEEIGNGLSALKENIQTLRQGATILQNSYKELEKGFSSFSDFFTTISSAVEQMHNSYSAIEQSLKAAAAKNPEWNGDELTQALQIAEQGKSQTEALLGQLQSITPKYNEALQSFQAANASMAQITGGLEKMEQGVAQLQSGASTLAKGLQTGAEGTATILDNTNRLQSGLKAVNEGQQQLQQGLATLQDKMGELHSGLSQSAEGLSQIKDGLVEAQDYLTELTSTSDEVFYIPQEVLEGEEFKESLDMYMSEDRQITKINIILDVNPYSQEAMSIIENIDEQVKGTLKGLNFSDAQVALGGKSAQNVDLRNVSTGDFARTISIMLAGIAIVLLIITRSFWKTLLIISSLVIAYFTALGASEIISKYTIDQSMFGWNVPFFSFIMIITLGVDYSIFLMMRYLENADQGYEAIIDAEKQIGGVVLSAAIILGGTFAALVPSGIVSLVQIAVIVMVGLVMLSLVMLPSFMPAVMGLTHKVKTIVTRKKEQ